MTAMAKRKPRESDKPDDHNASRGHREAFHILDAERDAFFRYLDETEPAPSKTAVLRAALREFLAKRGFWPPNNDLHPDGD